MSAGFYNLCHFPKLVKEATSVMDEMATTRSPEIANRASQLETTSEPERVARLDAQHVTVQRQRLTRNPSMRVQVQSQRLIDAKVWGNAMSRLHEPLGPVTMPHVDQLEKQLANATRKSEASETLVMNDGLKSAQRKTATPRCTSCSC